MQQLLPLTSTSTPESAEKISYAAELEFKLAGENADLDAALRFLDAYRVRISHSFDRLSSLSNSRTRLLAHQIEAAHIVSGAIKPRFLIADEVGLGKTIEAGLVIKELMIRRGYQNILICVPATLVVQWQNEMRSRFNEHYTILNRANFSEIMQTRSRSNKFITSIDFIKNARYGQALLRRHWDLAVFDEAHRLRRDYSKITVSYAFAEQVAMKCEALLLLSATPFRGKIEELFYLIRLIDPHVLGPISQFLQDDARADNSDLRKKISRVLIRRRKIDVGGFTHRHAQTIRFDLSLEERAFYDETTDYVKREYNIAMAQENRMVGFVMIVFQKLLDSSSRALLQSLANRKMKLESILGGKTGSSDAIDDSEWDDAESPDDLMDGVRDKRTWAELRKEILTLQRLLHLGKAIRQDRKLIKLKETLELLKSKGSRKFIIFTQFKSTLDYLVENLSEYKCIGFHGSLRLQEKENAIQEFKDSGEILISTEAGGEGRNLQFSNILFNYDLPWSPLKIEQRIGRIHRFGQTKDVYIFNFATRDTVSERVLEVLVGKIKLFEESIGPSDALLGAVQDEADFQRDIMDFVTNKRTKKELEIELAAKLETAQRGYAKLQTLAVPHQMNFNWDDYYEFTKKERNINHRIIERITLSYLKKYPARGNLTLTGIDYELDAGDSKKRASFDSERALENDSIEFLALGHPLVEEAMEHFLTGGVNRMIHSLRLPGYQGYYFIFSANFSAGVSTMELISAVVDNEKVTVPDELLIQPGFQSNNTQKMSHDSLDLVHLRRNLNIAMRSVNEVAEIRRQKMEKTMHGEFIKEEIKIERSHGKHLKGLREKQDIQKMRATLNPVFETKASLARTEKEISRTETSRQLDLEKVRRMSHARVQLELIQIFALQS